MRTISAYFFVILFAVIIYSCSPTAGDDNCICTEEFRTDYLYIINSDGAPVDSLTTTMINEATGDTLVNNNGAFVYEPGMYWLIDDKYVLDLTTSPNNFIFTAKNDTASVGAVFQYATDNCKCHIKKIAGPDTLVIN